MNAEKTIYKFISYEENVGQNHNTDIGNKTLKGWQTSDRWEKL